jgi:hypothetical protein
MKAAGDVGPQVLEFLYKGLQIDDRWAVREDRLFSWLAYRLEQRILAEPVRHSHGYDIVRVHAATGVLRGVPITPGLYVQLARLNMFASLGALVASLALWPVPARADLSGQAVVIFGKPLVP